MPAQSGTSTPLFPAGPDSRKDTGLGWDSGATSPAAECSSSSRTEHGTYVRSLQTHHGIPTASELQGGAGRELGLQQTGVRVPGALSLSTRFPGAKHFQGILEKSSGYAGSQTYIKIPPFPSCLFSQERTAFHGDWMSMENAPGDRTSDPKMPDGGHARGHARARPSLLPCASELTAAREKHQRHHPVHEGAVVRRRKSLVAPKLHLVFRG